VNLSFIKTIQSGAVFFWLLLLNTQPSVASNAHNSGLFSRWIATPLREVRTEKGTFKGKILERMVYSGDTAFAVGNIVYFQFPKSIASPQAPAEIIEKIGYALGLKKWSKRSESNAVIYETAWPAAQRYLRIYIIETPISWTYSIAMFRTAYFSSVALESEILQRNLARGPKDPKTWLEQWLFSWNSSSWTNTAYADAAACPSCASDDIPCLIAATHCSEKALIQEIGALNVNLKIIGTEAIPDLNKNWSSTNVALSEINKSWIGTNAEVKNISTEIKRTNDALAQFMQPQNAFLWAAASASGAALGTLSVNLAMDALVAGGNAIMEAITHAKEEAQIVDRFRAAREAWEKMTTLSGSIEKTIDQLLGLRALSKTFKMSREELISRLGAKRAESEARLRNVNRLLEEAVDRDNQVCIAEFSTESSQLSSVVEEISKLKQHLEAPQADQTLCLQLRNNFQRLRELEDGLQEARAAIYGGREP
jgi:ribosomal protein S15P/S13E